jgi:ubiquinone/menaquinone biosynthesis C-methylase UbiE
LSHHERIERAFTQQAAAFEDPRYNRVFTSDAAWLFERLPRTGTELVLDVAGGTGHASRQLAPTVRTVVTVDATAAMLAQGQAKAAAEGIDNIVFMRADATALPFLDSSFDIVACRFAVHHFEQPQIQIAEMARVLKAGGQLVIADLTASEDPGEAAQQNEIERLRDPSHTRMLAATELSQLIEQTGLPAPTIDARELTRPLQPWLEQTDTSPQTAAEIRRRLNGADELKQTFASAISRGDRRGP